MKRRRHLVLVATVIGSIVMAGMAYTVLRDRGGGEDGLILVVEGEEHNVYVENKTTLEAMKGMESAPYFELLFKPWNESECWEKAREFIPDPVLEDADGRTYTFHSKNNSDIWMRISKFFKISYINREEERKNQILDREDILPKQKYIDKAIEVIKKYRGNISDLRLQTMRYPEAENEEEDVVGYMPVRIVFRQYLYGMPVEGAGGIVGVEFGRNMVLISYEDRTLPPERVFNRVNTGHVIPPKEMLEKIANNEGGPRNIVVKSITLSFFAPGTPRIVRYNGGSPGMWVPMKYRIVIRPANGGTGMILYYDAI